MRSALAAALAASLVIPTPGAQAWAGVASVVRTAPPLAGPAPALGGLGVGPAPISLTGLTPSLPSPTSPSRLALPSPAVPAAALRAAPAAAAAAALPSPRAQAARKLEAMAEAAAPQLEIAAAPGGAASVHGAGRALENILTGRSIAGGFAAEPAVDLRTGVLPVHECGLGHDHGHSHAEPEAAARPLPPAARRSFAAYTAGVSMSKVGVEALNLVVPILLLTQYGTAAAVGAFFVSSQLAGLVAGAAAGPLIDRLGAARALAASAAAQGLAMAAVPAALLLGLPVGLPVLFGLFTLNGALAGVSDIARRAALPGLVGGEEGLLRRCNAKVYLVRELAAIASVFGAGWLLQRFGALPALGLHPLAYAGAAALFVLMLKGPGALRPGAGPAPGPPDPPGAAWRDLAAGARAVLEDPALRMASLVNVPVIALHNLFHAMLAAVYATGVLHSPAMAAVMLGAWNAGELAAAFWLDRRGERAESRAWLRCAALASLSGWALWAIPSIWVAAPVSFLLAAATLGNEIGLASVVQAAAPKERLGAVTGFVYSAATAAAMALTLALGWAFDALGPSAGFLGLAAALTAASVFYLAAARWLKR